MPSSKLPIYATFLLISSVPGCSGGEAASVRDARGTITDSSAGTVELGLSDAPAYRPTVPGGATLVGSVRIRGADSLAASDSIVAVPRDRAICGDSANVVEVRAMAGALANALVWIEDIATGKPLPEVRRDRLTIQNCRFQPRLMAVARGTTINIFSADRTEHDARFYREGAGESVEHVRTFNAGSVVPSEKIAKEPGIVEVRSRHHPWARGFIAVFNHPYYAVTDEKGAFQIEGLAPGTYTMKVWHEGLEAPFQQRVTIGANGTARLDLEVPLG